MKDETGTSRESTAGSVDLLDDTVGLTRTETGDVGEEVGVVRVADGLVDVDADTVGDLDEGALESSDDLVLGELLS
jgi:hypothetical protein